jgi:uncharacterized protein
MLLDLNRLRGQREHFERTFPPSAFDPPDSDYRVAGPADLVLDVTRLAEDAFGLAGRVKTRLQVTCSRCLDPFDVPIDAAFDLRYVPHSENAGDDEAEVGEDDLATAFFRDGMVDLIELMREQFVLALPMKPLCGEACRGFCPDCGANLNTTQCDCAPKWEDPRLAPLKSLLSKNKEN